MHKTEIINGKKTRIIDIYYRGIGIISPPVNFEEFEKSLENFLNNTKTA